MNNSTRSGYVAIVGQPNVGKSTLMNHLLGLKLSITSKKPQTTRHRILGIKTIEHTQIIYVDTPGLHLRAKNEMNRIMNRAAKAVLHDVDLIIFMIEALQWNQQDQWILNLLKTVKVPVILAINKIDELSSKEELLPFIDEIKNQFNFLNIIPISAKNNLQIDLLENEIIKHLPKDVHYFPPDQITDRSDRFIASEIVREKLTRFLGQELPYSVTVTIDAFEESEKIIKISATIYVAKESQKAIVIGQKGERLKLIGQKARIDMETYFEKKVFLKLWVKVKRDWIDDKRILQSFGYDEK